MRRLMENVQHVARGRTQEGSGAQEAEEQHDRAVVRRGATEGKASRAVRTEEEKDTSLESVPACNLFSV